MRCFDPRGREGDSRFYVNGLLYVRGTIGAFFCLFGRESNLAHA